MNTSKTIDHALPNRERVKHEESLRKSWYALFVLTMINSAHYLDRTVVSIVIEPIKAEFALSDGQLGLLTGLFYGVTFALAGIPLGILVDRVSRKKLMTILVLTWSGCTALGGLAQNFTHLALARMGVGAAEAGGSPTSMSLISDFFPPNLRSSAMGIFFLSMAVGGAMSAFIGSFVASNYGWRAAFFIASVPGVVFALLFFFTVREPRRGATDPVSKTSETAVAPTLKETFNFIRSQKALVHLFIAMPLAVMAISAISAWLVAFFMRSHTMSLENASILAGITFGAFAAFGSLMGGVLADYFGRHTPSKRLIFVGIVSLIGVPLAVVAILVDNTYLAVGSWFALAAVSFATVAPTFSCTVTLAKPKMRGVTLAALQVVVNLIGYGVAPFLVGTLSDWYGGGESLRYALLTVIAGTLGWAMLHFFASARHFENDTERAREL